MSEEERARASRFAFEKLRRHFIVRRGILRTLLASYLEAHPRDLGFRYGRNDKPRLLGKPTWEALSFNTTHSQGMALFAVARGREVGVDLEWIRDDVDQAEIGARHFAPSEAKALAGAPLDAQVRLFFTYWTCKEAFVKAKGGGLSIPLDQFAVRLVPGEGTARVICIGDPCGDSRWLVHQLAAAPGYAAALAVDDPDLRISLWEWSTRPGASHIR